MGIDPGTHRPLTDQKQREEKNSVSDLWMKTAFDPVPMTEFEVCDIDPIYTQLMQCIRPSGQTELTTSSDFDFEVGSSISSNSSNVIENVGLNWTSDGLLRSFPAAPCIFSQDFSSLQSISMSPSEVLFESECEFSGDLI